jgi:primosomal protein N'
MSPKCFQLEVAPLTVLPFQKAVFSYLSREPVSPGALVRISFAGRTLSGAVIRVTPLEEAAEELKLKYISGIIDPNAFTEHQIQLAQSISQDTFTSLGKVLKHMDPKRVTERIKKIPEDGAPAIKLPRATKEDTALAASIAALPAKETRIFLTLPSTQAGLLSLVRVLLAYKKKDSQILVLVPDILLLEQTLSLFTALAPKETSAVAVLHSHRSAGAYYTAWQNIQNGSAQIILATRHGIFAPFKNLATVFHIEPSDDAYKQWDMSPRYQTSAAVDTLLGLTGARLL